MSITALVMINIFKLSNVFCCHFTLLQDGRTPLHICCIKGKMEMVKLLIECGSNITAKDKVHT